MNTTPAGIPAAKQAPGLNWPLLWTAVVVGLVAWGSHANLERYITPQRGVGYWLGITGGSMLLLLLTYSARKHVTWLRWMGAIAPWFKFHMILGVVGPLLILFHSNFRLGATNSNVALFSMLLVAGSGVIGRYIYTRLHAQMGGKEDSLEQLKAVGTRLRAKTTSLELLPGLLDAIDRVERRLIEPPMRSRARFLHLLTGPYRIAMARFLVRREIKAAVNRASLGESPRTARRADRLAAVAGRYAYRRFDAVRRVQEYQMYDRLFSFWHVVHVPLFFMLLISGIVHVIAINVY